jgi:nitrogen fixation protein NifX
MKVAFASTDKEHINQHFGWSKKFQLFEIDKENYSFLHEIDSSEEPEEEVAKLNYKIETIKEADIMYCTQIGPKASQMVQAAKIYPVRAVENEDILMAISKIQDLLNGNPPPWLLRIYHNSQQKEAN